jgi:hypothetical protein
MERALYDDHWDEPAEDDREYCAECEDLIRDGEYAYRTPEIVLCGACAEKAGFE